MKQTVNEENILACIAFMKASNDVAFSMYQFNDTVEGRGQYCLPAEITTCKTAACVAGFECLRLGTAIDLEGERSPSKVAAESFGLRRNEEDLRDAQLFSPASPLNGGFSWSAQFGEGGYITKEHAIECMYLLIETGEVRWAEAKQRLDAKEAGQALCAAERKKIYDLFLPKEFHPEKEELVI